MRTPKPRAVSQLKKSILNTALTTHYECWFNPPAAIAGGIQGPTGDNATNGLIPNSRSDLDYTLSCIEASLPVGPSIPPPIASGGLNQHS